MKQITKYCRIVLLFCCCLFLFPTKTGWAQEYKAEYKAEYFPDLKGNSQVKLDIKITNLRSDIYVKEFGLTFPSNFTIDNIIARDDNNEIPSNIVNQEQSFKLKLIFTSPSTGKGSENNFYLSFFQKNLFNINENVWEIILPTIIDEKGSVFNIIVHLPDKINKKLSIAKPKPTLIKDNKIYWNNITTKTVYAVLGDYQTYELDLLYNLHNEKLIPVYYDIAFPPETLNQKVFIQSIEPKPEKVHLDEDGNYLGRYNLNSKEHLRIIFKGFVQVFVHPQELLNNYIQTNFVNQKKYLLTQQKYWTIDKDTINSNEFKKIQTPEEVYKYVVNKLNYNYKRINKNIKRIGADQILKQPDLAVCMEFTDLFIALAREKGIYSKEINGYGFSHDPNLRPLSLASDILHSWPEYFNEKNSVWVPVDPTWENTSGIDYFNSFDLNHIVFAIHGKSSTQPLSAGMYKIEDSKDVSIKIASALPKEQMDAQVNDNVKSEIIDRGIYKAKITITNNGNVFIKKAILELKSPILKIFPDKIHIDLLAPYQSNIYEIDYRSLQKNVNKEGIINTIFNDSLLETKKIRVVSIYLDLFYKSLGAFIGCFCLLGVYLIFSRHGSR